MTQTLSWADHRVFPGTGGALLYGVDHASLFAVDDEVRDVLGRWRWRDPLVLAEVPEADRVVLEDLRGAGVLVPAGARAMRHRPDPEEIPLGTLVLEVSQACNLRCGYCYAGGGTYGGEPMLLDPAEARRAARYLVEASGDRDRVTLVLFGGEPLLNMEAVVAALEEAEEAAARTGKAVDASLTTNATLLTPEVIEVLRRHRVSVSVSLDGPPDIHDANRPTADGAGSYHRIVSRLGALLDGATTPVAARVTLTPAQWGRIPEVFDHLTGLGFHEVGIAPASPVTEELIATEEQEDRLFAGLSDLAGRFREAALEGRVLPLSNLLDLLARIHAGQAKSVACGAGLGYLALDARGRFFLCHRLAGEEAFAVGDLHTGPDAGRIRSCLDALAAPRDEECGQCWARSLCAGGCHYDNHLREHLLGLAPGGNCRFIRRWLELGLGLYAELRGTRADAIVDRLGRRCH